MTRSRPRWLRYLIAVPLMAVWVLLASVGVASSAWLAALCDAGVNTSVGCGVVMFVAATACTWFLVDGLVWWCDAPLQPVLDFKEGA